MSDGDFRRVSIQDIQLVQNLIERCLQLYMTRGEVVNTLLRQAKIEPGFTELVWQKLESENQEFFKAYHLRLAVRDQILQFNQLLERQVELMRQMRRTGAPSISLTNGSQIQPTFQTTQPIVSSIKPENMHQVMSPIPDFYPNGSPALPSCMQAAVSVIGHTGRIVVPENAPSAQSSNAVMIQGMNGDIIKPEPDYVSDPPFMFGTDSNLLEPRVAIVEGSVPHFDGADSGSHEMSKNMLDPNMNSFGFLGQIPRNFSLSDLTADFSNSTDILESYSRSPFLGTDANFLDPCFRDDQQDIRRLNTISEGFNYEDFVSD